MLMLRQPSQFCATYTGLTGMVIPPLIMVLRSRGYAAILNFCTGVIPPSAILGRS